MCVSLVIVTPMSKGARTDTQPYTCARAHTRLYAYAGSGDITNARLPFCVYIHICICIHYHIYTRTRSLCIRTYMYIYLYMCGTWWRSRMHAYNVAITLKYEFRYTHMHSLHIYVQIYAYIHMHDLVEITDARLKSCIHMYKCSNMHTHSLYIYTYIYVQLYIYICRTWWRSRMHAYSPAFCTATQFACLLLWFVA